MIVWRKIVARNEDDQLHVLHTGAAVPQQVMVANKLEVIDKWGKTPHRRRGCLRPGARRPLGLPELGPGLVQRHLRELIHMMNRAHSSIGLQLGSALIGLFLGAAGAGLQAADMRRPPECSSCHDQAQKLEKSAHTGLPCDTCHESHEKYPHPAGIPKPACTTCHQDQAGDYAGSVHGQARKSGNEGAPDCALCHGSAHELLPPKSQTFRTAVPDTCGMCHTEVVEQYRASVHGQALARGITQAPLCTDCHGEHKILKHTNEASPVNAAHIRDTCGSCHGDVRLTRKFGMPSDRLVSFDSSFHGLAAKSGSQTVANCASCHGVHNILPSSDAKSTINAKNLPKTCGQCHPGAGHALRHQPGARRRRRHEPAALRWVREFYLLVIPVTIGLMLLHNGGDWIRKLIRARFRARLARRTRPPQPGTANCACCRSSASSTRCW